jgi:diaminopimelate epimerase
MGEPILTAEQIPTTLPGDPPILSPLTIGADSFLVTCVSMGNPHCVIFVEEISDALVHGFGPKIENHGAFPKRANVEFVKVNRPDDVTMRVWERGSGETMACGTGACAVVVAGVLAKKTDRRITAHLRGGDLSLEWSAADNHVYKTGPAVEVFSGDWEPSRNS